MPLGLVEGGLGVFAFVFVPDDAGQRLTDLGLADRDPGIVPRLALGLSLHTLALQPGLQRRGLAQGSGQALIGAAELGDLADVLRGHQAVVHLLRRRQIKLGQPAEHLLIAIEIGGRIGHATRKTRRCDRNGRRGAFSADRTAAGRRTLSLP